MEERKGYKMYSIVLRQLDGQNKGIQTAHGVCEYIRKHWDDEDLQQWLNTDKTLVMLSGGTVSDMSKIMEVFKEHDIKFETFEEEDLGNLTTSICVLADEKVWDKDNYPIFDIYKLKCSGKGISEDVLKKEFISLVGGIENTIKKEILNNLRLA
jgi:hypothetical protein